MKDVRMVIGSLGFIAFVTIAIAKETAPNPHWLSNGEVKALLASEPPPPAPDSAEDKADLQADIDAQKTRTDAQVDEAKKDANYSVALFTDSITPKITPQCDPVTFHFFDELNVQIGEVVTLSKNHFHRLRPYLGHPDVIHSVFPAGGFSYPSGHSAHSWAFAVVLGQIYPDQAQAFLDRAHQIAQSRVDAGVHYPTDINEGEVLGKEIAKELLAKPEFQKRLQAAKAEIAAQK
jgi:acid phosphatase (class A)